MIGFVARGVIRATGGNDAWVGRYTYVSEPNLGFYQWDGLHKVKFFGTADDALSAAGRCQGPLFQLPDPATIEALEMPAG